jgi:hypothetical protein
LDPPRHQLVARQFHDGTTTLAVYGAISVAAGIGLLWTAKQRPRQ